MKKIILPIIAAALLAGGLPGLARANDAPATATAPAAEKTATANPEKVNATKDALRDLWIGHIFWVRNVVVYRLEGNKAAEANAEKEVVANAQSIAGAIEPFYGAGAKDKLFKLLAGHYGAVKAYLDATVAKDKTKQDDATKQLLANADEIATFLSGANPNLPKDTLVGLLQAHGGHHISQIQQLTAKNYAGEAKTWADMSQHMYVIADALADAIAKQFPEKF
jgi:hypothetical protein